MGVEYKEVKMAESTQDSSLEKRIAPMDITVDEEVNKILENTEEAVEQAQEINSLQKSLLAANLMEKLSLGLFKAEGSDEYTSKLTQAEKNYDELKLRIKFRVNARRMQGIFKDVKGRKNLKYLELDPPAFANEKAENLLEEMPIGSFFLHNCGSEEELVISMILPEVTGDDLNEVHPKVVHIPTKNTLSRRDMMQMSKKALSEKMKELDNDSLSFELHFLH